MKDVYLVEDHDQALAIWQRHRIRGCDLVHLDAHIDFCEYQAKDLQESFREAKSLRELKKQLELSIAFSAYEKDFSRQTNIGNYIYPAMKQGIVNNFWWIIPGGKKEFRRSLKMARDILKNIVKAERIELHRDHIRAALKSKSVYITYLDALPEFLQPVLLDIDVDYLTLPSILEADPSINIGKASAWIQPRELVKELKVKIKSPRITTIAYSTSGGFTPMKYRYFGDEIAFRLSPKEFKIRYARALKGAKYFHKFLSDGNKRDYTKAVRIDPYYRSSDNNLGPLYLMKRRFGAAQREFTRTYKADPHNPAALIGLGEISLVKKDYLGARSNFFLARRSCRGRVFKYELKHTFLGLGKTELALKNFKKAKELLKQFQRVEPLQPETYYLLGTAAEKEKNWLLAIRLYKDALRLGYPKLVVLEKLIKICFRIEDKVSIISYSKGMLGLCGREINKFKKVNGPKSALILEKKLHEIKKRLLFEEVKDK